MSSHKYYSALKMAGPFHTDILVQSIRGNQQLLDPQPSKPLINLLKGLGVNLNNWTESNLYEALQNLSFYQLSLEPFSSYLSERSEDKQNKLYAILLRSIRNNNFQMFQLILQLGAPLTTSELIMGREIPYF